MAHTGTAFDRLAGSYDDLWSNAAAGRLQRDAVWRNIEGRFRPGDRVLDLGCGTGVDAVWLRDQGVCVTAIDASPAMVARSLNNGIDAKVMRLEDLDNLPGNFNGMLSNFGAFNCIEELETLRSSLAARLLPGGYFVLCVMGRFCFWETIWYAMQGQFGKAARRWTGTADAISLGIRVRYFTVAKLRRSLEPDFKLVRVTGIGIAVPPSYVTNIPAPLAKMLGSLDSLLEHFPLASAVADHRLLIFVRQ